MKKNNQTDWGEVIIFSLPIIALIITYAISVLGVK